MIRRKATVGVAIVALGFMLSGCSLLGGDTLAQPELAGAAIEIRCAQVLGATKDVNVATSAQFNALNADMELDTTQVRDRVEALAALKPGPPLQDAVDELVASYAIIADELDTGSPDPDAITEASNKVMSYSESLAVACS